MGAESLQVYRLVNEIFLLMDDGSRRTLRVFDLSVAQFNALLHLDQVRGLPMSQLSDLLFCDKANATRLIDMLEKKGLVRRDADPQDRRLVCVRLTGQGAAVRAQAQQAHIAAVDLQLIAMQGPQLATLTELLSALRDSLRRMNEELGARS